VLADRDIVAMLIALEDVKAAYPLQWPAGWSCTKRH
jgi:hypothetical protein